MPNTKIKSGGEHFLVKILVNSLSAAGQAIIVVKEFPCKQNILPLQNMAVGMKYSQCQLTLFTLAQMQV